MDRETLQTEQVFNMTKLWPSVKEGWGITQDPQSKVLYVSDGTAHLTKIDAENLQELSRD